MDGHIHKNNYGGQQAGDDLMDGPGRFDPKPGSKKHRLKMFSVSDAVTVASAAFKQDRGKRQTRDSGRLEPSFSEPSPSSPEPRPAGTDFHEPRNLAASMSNETDNHDFAPKPGYIFDPSRGAWVPGQDHHQAHSPRNLDSFGSTLTQPGSTFLDDHQEAQPERMIVTVS